MKLSAPTQMVWVIALVLGVLGILGKFATLPVVSEHHFTLVALGFGVLALGTLFKGA